jgi:hypothetical protein
MSDGATQEVDVTISLVMLSRDLSPKMMMMRETCAHRSRRSGHGTSAPHARCSNQTHAWGLPCEQRARWQGRMLHTASVPHSASFHVAAIASGGRGPGSRQPQAVPPLLNSRCGGRTNDCSVGIDEEPRIHSSEPPSEHGRRGALHRVRSLLLMEACSFLKAGKQCYWASKPAAPVVLPRPPHPFG